MKNKPQTITRMPAYGWLNLEPQDCPLRAQHTPSPDGYLAWQDWAEAKAKTHRQMRCAGCHRWSVWVPKGGSTVLNGIDAVVIATGRDPR